jgi:hypothetical protein
MTSMLRCTIVVLGVLIATAAPAWAQSVLPRAGWIATGSSSASGSSAASAIDGSSSTRWSTGTDQTPGQWFTLDMIQAQTFSQITIDPAGSTTDFTIAYQVFVSNDALAWTAVASGVGSSGVLTIVFPTQVARFVGVVQTGTGTYWWSIAEINVYGPGATPSVALSPTGWTASASDSSTSDIPSHAIDGTLSTRWSTGKPQASPESFQLDMASIRDIKGILMDSGNSISDYPRAFQVFATNDLSNWGSPVVVGTGTSAQVAVTFPTVSARYLKIALTGSASNWWSIAELTVFGVGSFAPAPTALPRTGWGVTASVSCSSDVPSRAIDDDLTTRYSTCQSQVPGQSFQVDMTAPMSFSSITLDSGSSTGDYPRGFSVYVSNDNSNWGSPVATGAGSSALVTITFPSQTARYIKIVQTSSASNWWSIHELNVYGVRPVLLIRDNWVASASLSSSNAALGIDGKLSTRWTTNTPQVSGQTYQVDMLSSQEFNQITLNSDGASSDYPRGYAVYVSNNPNSWGSPVATGVGSASPVSISFPAQTARYLQIVQTGAASNWWSISEINVWQSAVSTCVSDANCDDNNRCTVDSCDLVLGCMHSLAPCLREGQIEAETFDSANNMTDDGVSLTPIAPNAYAEYDNVDFGASGTYGRIKMALIAAPGNAHVQFYLDSLSGPLLADLLTLPSDPTNPASQSVLMKNPPSGVHSVFIVFPTTGSGALDWFMLQPGSPDVATTFPSSFQHPSSGPPVDLSNLQPQPPDSDDDTPPVGWMQLNTPITLAPGQTLTFTFGSPATYSIIAQARWTAAIGNINLVVMDAQGNVVASAGATSSAAGGVTTCQTDPLPSQQFTVQLTNNGTGDVPVLLLAGAVGEVR